MCTLINPILFLQHPLPHLPLMHYSLLFYKFGLSISSLSSDYVSHFSRSSSFFPFLRLKHHQQGLSSQFLPLRNFQRRRLVLFLWSLFVSGPFQRNSKSVASSLRTMSAHPLGPSSSSSSSSSLLFSSSTTSSVASSHNSALIHDCFILRSRATHWRNEVSFCFVTFSSVSHFNNNNNNTNNDNVNVSGTDNSSSSLCEFVSPAFMKKDALKWYQFERSFISPKNRSLSLLSLWC